MNREQFFARLGALDQDRLAKALWNLYWRGSATLRERIERELEPAGSRPRPKPPVVPDPESTLFAVQDFAELARAGAYIAGDRRVSPRERTRWRFTFRRLMKDSGASLADMDSMAGAEAMELLIELAQEMRGYEYFRSEDPIEAAAVVISDEVALLWGAVIKRRGFAQFASLAAPQLIRWESPYGWTRTGYGRVPERETSLAAVLEHLLKLPDHWVTFTDRYLDALDRIIAPAAASPSPKQRRRNSSPVSRSDQDQSRAARAKRLAQWHELLLEHLFGTEAEDRLDRIAAHRALGGPELDYFKALLAQRRDELESARTLISGALEKLPGNTRFYELAADLDAPIPKRALELARRWAS